MTEVGMIPEDWEYALFKDIFTFYPTNTYARDFMNDSEGEVFNVHYGDILVRYGSILDFEKIQVPFLNADSTNWSNRALLKDGDIIIADTAEDETCGKLTEVYGLREKKAVSGLHTMLCRPKEDLFVPKFLGYFMNGAFYHNQLLPLMVGTKVTSVSKSAILDTWILIPPKEIQQHIADALTDIDRLIEPINAEIEKKRQIKEGAMQALLTGKKRLSGFTGEWVDRSLSEVGKFVSGNGFPLAYQGNKSEKYPFFKVSDFNNVGNELHMHIANNYISEDVAKILSCNIIPTNSIIFAKIGAAIMLERKRICSQPSCIDNNMMSLQLYSSFDTDFVLYVLRTIQFSQYVSATALPSLGGKTLGKIVVHIPEDKKEQYAIAHILTDMDAEIYALEAERDKYTLIKQGMMQELLTGKTRLV